MKILLLIDSLGSGGAQRQILALAKMLRMRHHDVSLIIYYEYFSFKKEVDKFSIPVFLIREKFIFKRIYKIRKFIRRGNYDVVISFLETPNFINCISAVGGKTWKVITSERSSNEKSFRTLKGKMFKWFLRYSDTIVCNSFKAKDMWEKYMIEYSEKLYVIYNFVILPTITSKYIPKKNGKLNITIAANYKYNKNPIGLINAVSMMTKEERSKIVINWYGTTDIGEETISVYNESVTLIKTQKLEDIIHLNNSSKDIANIMNEADVVALFSKLEGLPNAICEGMMLGKPIIMTRVSDYKALVDNSNGFLCEWDNNYSIKDALIKASIIKKDDLLIMGYNSKLKANYLFSQETIMNDWAHIIELNK